MDHLADLWTIGQQILVMMTHLSDLLTKGPDRACSHHVAGGGRRDEMAVWHLTYATDGRHALFPHEDVRLMAVRRLADVAGTYMVGFSHRCRSE
jgi:hypothetical protein